MRGGARQRSMSHEDVAVRAEHARSFLETATDARTLHGDRANVAIANAVLAGIAAADAICGRALRVSARGEAHGEAVLLLESVASVGRPSANDLRRLIAVKTNSSYSAMVLSPAAADDAIRWASRLVEAMETVLAGP